MLSRPSLDYRVRVAHLVAAARSGGAGEWRSNAILIDVTPRVIGAKTMRFGANHSQNFGEVIILNVATIINYTKVHHIILFIHHLDVIIDTLITSLIFFMLSLTLIAMSGPASTSHNMYLYSIDSEQH